LTAYLERAAERVQTHQDGLGQVAVLEAVAEGWATQRKVRVEYRSPRTGSLRERVIHPYAVEPTAGGMYVIGHDEWAQDIRTFKLERLERAQVLEESFTLPEGLNLEPHLASSWGIMTGPGLTDVVLRFAPSATPHVRERRWHPSQKLEVQPDGSCVLRVRVSEPLEMQPWIRSWGAQVEVLEPSSLRERIAEEWRRAAGVYGVDPDNVVTGGGG